MCLISNNCVWFVLAYACLRCCRSIAKPTFNTKRDVCAKWCFDQQSVNWIVYLLLKLGTPSTLLTTSVIICDPLRWRRITFSSTFLYLLWCLYLMVSAADCFYMKCNTKGLRFHHEMVIVTSLYSLAAHIHIKMQPTTLYPIVTK